MRFFPNGFASARRARAWTKYLSVQGVHAISRDSERDARCRRRRVLARRCEFAHARDWRKAANKALSEKKEYYALRPPWHGTNETLDDVCFLAT